MLRKHTVAVVTFSLAVAALAGAGAAAAGPASGAQREAERALARAETALLARRAVNRPDATLALRDLAVRVRDLPVAQRARAAALLDRPTTPGNPRGYRAPSVFTCSTVCVHWVESTADAPPLRDADGDRLPDWVETTLAALDGIWTKEVVEFGFRPPKSDEMLPEHGPDGRLDVYLADVSDEVLGYCIAEVPSNYPYWDVPGHCVLDNDYSPGQLATPNESGLLALERTAAHEFFHAVQFAYDYGEDGWLMEGTAVWMETMVFDTEDTYGWFPYTALRHPDVPIDSFSRSRPFQYGSWLFWRFLEELFSPQRARDPSVIRRVWEWADGSPIGPDLYSLQAVEAAARERGSSLRAAFSAFGVANVMPQAFYRDGRAYPSAPRARSFTLSRTRPQTGRQRLVLDHLTNGSVEFRPGPGVSGRTRLRLVLDLPSTARGSAASLVVSFRSGRRQVSPVAINGFGDATVHVPFGRRAVAGVVLVLTNASGRFACRLNTFLSCSGQPLDDDLVFSYSASLR